MATKINKTLKLSHTTKSTVVYSESGDGEKLPKEQVVYIQQSEFQTDQFPASIVFQVTEPKTK